MKGSETLQKEIKKILEKHIGTYRKEFLNKYELGNHIPKHINRVIVSRILQENNIDEKSEDFIENNILIKTIQRNKKGINYQDMSFPAFTFEDLLNKKWKESNTYKNIFNKNYIFVVFREDDEKSNPYIEKVVLHKMSKEDEIELKKVWSKTIDIINSGVELTYDACIDKVYNNLPGRKDSYLSHVRPHSGGRGYKFNDKFGKEIIIGDEKHGSELSDDKYMIKSCFWLNNTYIRNIINLD